MPEAAILDFSPQMSSVENLCIGAGTTRPTVYPQESVFCVNQGQENQGKEALKLVVVIVTACFPGLLHGDTLPV